MKYITKMHVDIMDRRYGVFFCTAKEYKRLAPEGSKAFVNLSTRRIYFDCEAVVANDNVAAHEITHIYCAELLGHDLNFQSAAEHEEHFCSIVERRGADILAKAKPITRKLMQIRKRFRKSRRGDGDEGK
jgi:hypothetical protein